ncbi:hypothetical protein D3C72_856190 [compost metagenome]
MTPKHQIEILTRDLFDFSHLTRFNIQSEKEKSIERLPNAFSLADVTKGYLSFLTENVHNENNKIIEEKMDEIIVGRILESRVFIGSITFKDILSLIDSKLSDSFLSEWFRVSNNLIGFCCGIKFSYSFIQEENIEETRNAFKTFELAFSAIKPSKVNLGKFRRELSFYFVKNYRQTKGFDTNELIGKFLEITAN